MRVEELRPLPIFEGLTDRQRAELAGAGTEVAVEPGAELFREGEPADFWWVLVEGSIDLVRRVGREELVVARMDVPGRWAGGFRAWDEHGVYLATGRGAAPGRVLRVPAGVLRDRSNAWFPFGGTSSRGSTARPAPSSPPPASGSPWSPWARSRPAWPTRSTTRPLPPGGRSPPWRPPVGRWSRPWAGWPGASSRPSGSPPSTPSARS